LLGKFHPALTLFPHTLPARARPSTRKFWFDAQTGKVKYSPQQTLGDSHGVYSREVREFPFFAQPGLSDPDACR
jgi:hypothetical protein